MKVKVAQRGETEFTDIPVGTIFNYLGENYPCIKVSAEDVIYWNAKKRQWFKRLAWADVPDVIVWGELKVE